MTDPTPTHEVQQQPPPLGGLEDVRRFMDNEEEPPMDDADPPAEAEKPAGGRPIPSRGGGAWDPACPVTPLGVRGDRYFFLDALRQLRELEAGKTGRSYILSLFGDKTAFVYELWPNKVDNDTGRVLSWKVERAQEELMARAADAGVWDPFERVRGAGAWREEDGGLLLHCGNRLIHFPLDPSGDAVPTSRRPGKVGRYVYPTDPAQPVPAEVSPAYDTEDDPGAHLREILETWNWKRPDIDPVLLIGWIGAAMIGGALKWRPAAWITGGAGTGKSTLMDLIKLVLDDGLVSVADATGAGIWQKLGYKTLPVALDEQENEEDNRKINAVIKLARLAASGGMVLRGGADHQASEFVARSCFLFQSIITPPLLPQDRSRLAILDLLKLKGGEAVPAMEPAKMRAIGSALRRRIADAWPRLDAVLRTYREALEAEGHNSRGADQFGTLLALADVILLSPRESGVEAKEWALKLQQDSAFELGDAADAETQCLRKILTTIADAYRGGTQDTLSNWMAKATGRLHGDGVNDLTREANKILSTYGVKVVKEAGHQYLAVATSHEGLSRVFHGSQWATRSGAAEAPWTRQLRRLPGAFAAPKTVWIGSACRATLIPMSLIFPPDTDWKALADDLNCALNYNQSMDQW